LLINIFSFVKINKLDIKGCDCLAAIKAATSGADNDILPHQPFATQGNLSAPLSARAKRKALSLATASQSWQNKFAKRLYICDQELGTFWNFIRTREAQGAVACDCVAPFLCVRIIVKAATGPANIIRTYPPISIATGLSRH